MAFRPVIASSLVLAIALAGCAASPQASPNSAPPVVGDGAMLGGQILTPEQLPVVAAIVSLHDSKTFELRRNTTTGSEGHFDFGKVPVGNWIVAIIAPGYEDKSNNVTILAGVDQHIRVILQPIPVGVAYYETQTGTVTIQYGVAWSIGGDFNRGCIYPMVTCQAFVEAASAHEFTTDDPKLAPLTTIVIEDVWEANSPVCAKTIAVDLYNPDNSGTTWPSKDNPHYWTNNPHESWSITSPVVMVIPREQLGNMDAIDDPQRIEKNGGERLWVRGDWVLRHFPPGSGLTNLPVDANCFTEQQFDIYWTTFYKEPAPTDFSARA
jgi:hypothetical protein